jgi:hypothetical protein
MPGTLGIHRRCGQLLPTLSSIVEAYIKVKVQNGALEPLGLCLHCFAVENPGLEHRTVARPEGGRWVNFDSRNLG